MLLAKWSDHLKVSILSLIFLNKANFWMFVRCFKHILNAVTSPAFYNSYVNLPTHLTPLEYIEDNSKFYPFFTGAPGSVDGTHISAHPCFRPGMLSQPQGWHLTECPCSHYI